MSSVDKGLQARQLGCDHVENKRQRDQKETQAPRTGLPSLGEATNRPPAELSNGQSSTLHSAVLVSTDSHTPLLRPNKLSEALRPVSKRTLLILSSHVPKQPPAGIYCTNLWGQFPEPCSVPTHRGGSADRDQSRTRQEHPFLVQSAGSQSTHL